MQASSTQPCAAATPTAVRLDPVCPPLRVSPTHAPRTASRHSRGKSRWSPPAAMEPASSRMGRDTAGFSNQKRCRVLLQQQCEGTGCKVATAARGAGSSSSSGSGRGAALPAAVQAPAPGPNARVRVVDLYSVHALNDVLHALPQEVIIRVHMRLHSRGQRERRERVGHAVSAAVAARRRAEQGKSRGRGEGGTRAALYFMYSVNWWAYQRVQVAAQQQAAGGGCCRCWCRRRCLAAHLGKGLQLRRDPVPADHGPQVRHGDALPRCRAPGRYTIGQERRACGGGVRRLSAVAVSDRASVALRSVGKRAERLLELGKRWVAANRASAHAGPRGCREHNARCSRCKLYMHALKGASLSSMLPPSRCVAGCRRRRPA